MAKKQPIRIYFFDTNRVGNDTWKVVIDDPGAGPLTELRTRYTRPGSARRGGARKAKCKPVLQPNGKGGYKTIGWVGPDLRPVVFVNGKPVKR